MTTLKRILWTGLPVAALLAGLGFALAEATDLFLSANHPGRVVDVIDGAARTGGEPLADPLPAAVRRTLPVSMALWGFGLVAAYEGLRRLVKGPAKKAVAATKPAGVDVDKLLEDLMRKAEADRAGLVEADPLPASVTATLP